MNNRLLLLSAICLSFLYITGCWDRRELNDRALWAATGFDAADDQRMKVSGQIIVATHIQPTGTGGGGSGGSGDDKGYFVTAYTGLNLGEALQQIQADLSREAFFGQRRVIFIGEEFAKRGYLKYMDASIRGANVGLRTDLIVVKDRTAEDALKIPSTLEKIPAIAALKKHQEVGGRSDKAFLDFLQAANSQGIRPTLPVVEISKGQGDSNSKLLRFAGLAAFDSNLKLIGYLDVTEDLDFLWIYGALKKRTLFISVKDGNASLTLKDFRRKIAASVGADNRVRIHVTLGANALLLENNTQLNMKNSKDVKHLQRLFEKQTEKQILRTIRKLQKDFGVDIFGFGEAIHRSQPRTWNALKNDWDGHFSDADISVEVNLNIKQVGLSGPSLLFKR
jgi:spore germination protein KC